MNIIHQPNAGKKKLAVAGKRLVSLPIPQATLAGSSVQ